MDKAVINQLPIDSLRGKRVFVRMDADIEPPSDGVAVDELKLRAALPTLEYLAALGARVVIGTHLGDPGGTPVDSLRVDALAQRLSRVIDKNVRKMDEAIGRNVLAAVTEMGDGEIILLENLRFYRGEDANDGKFARDLAELCDVYCNDAFAIAHRGTASTVAITRHARPSQEELGTSRSDTQTLL